MKVTAAVAPYLILGAAGAYLEVVFLLGFYCDPAATWLPFPLLVQTVAVAFAVLSVIWIALGSAFRRIALAVAGKLAILAASAAVCAARASIRRACAVARRL